MATQFVAVDTLLEGAPSYVIGLVDIIKRTGAYSMQIREVDTPPPTVWCVVSEHYLDAEGRPTHDTTNDHAIEAAASPYVGVALQRLVAQLLDGGTCAHCNRPTIFHEDPDHEPEPWMRLVSCPVFWHDASGAYVLECQNRETT